MSVNIDQYKNYKADDFVLDTSFRKWVLNPDKASNIYWQEWIRKNQSKVGEIKKARELLVSIKTIDFQVEESTQKEVLANIISNIKSAEKEGSVTRESKVVPMGPHSIISRYDSKKVVPILSWKKWAAAAILLIASMFTIYLITNTFKDQPLPLTEDTVVKENPNGQRSNFMMSDGTKVTLNADSKLTYSSGYGKSNRTVYLEGEGFFEVAKMKELPFIVETEYLNTMALGTSFNISAYGKEGFEVSLFTGIVNVYEKETHESSYSVNLVPGERIVSNEDKTYSKFEFNTKSYALWRKGILSFNQTTFKEAMTILERWYAVNITYPKDLPSGLTFSGNFESEYLSSVLEVLGFNMDFDYEIKSKNVVITFK